MSTTYNEKPEKYICERKFFLELVRELNVYISPYRELWADKKFFMDVLSEVPDDKKKKAIRKILKKNNTVEYQEWLSRNFPEESKKIASDELCED